MDYYVWLHLLEAVATVSAAYIRALRQQLQQVQQFQKIQKMQTIQKSYRQKKSAPSTETDKNFHGIQRINLQVLFLVRDGLRRITLDHKGLSLGIACILYCAYCIVVLHCVYQHPRRWHRC